MEKLGKNQKEADGIGKYFNYILKPDNTVGLYFFLQDEYKLAHCQNVAKLDKK